MSELSEEELERAREIARKPWRFESTHPMKWSDLTDRLLQHIDALTRARDEARAQALVELSRDEVGFLIEAIRALFSEQPSAVCDEERALLERLEALLCD